MTRKPLMLTAAHYERLATLREAMGQFLHFSQGAAEAEGLTPQQHQALLAIKGFSANGPASVGQLAKRLFTHHHSAVGLVDRLARLGLVRRRPCKTDGRKVEVSLTAKGAGVIDRLSETHWLELQQQGPVLRSALNAILGGES